MGFKQPAFVNRIPKVGGERRRFGDILEEKVVPKTIGKQRLTMPGFEEDMLLELKAISRSFRKRIKRLKRKLGRVSQGEQPKITRMMEYMQSALAMRPKKRIKLIRAAALLKNLRKKPDFLIGTARLHLINRRYGRKPIENAKRRIKK